MITSPASIMYPNVILENKTRKSEMTDQSRMASFYSYPYTAGVSAFELSKAGFHYEGQNDEVICRHCGLRYSGWQKGDNPTELHMKIFPSCPFFQKGKSKTTVFKDNIQQENFLFPRPCREPVDVMVERKGQDRTTQQRTNTAFVTNEKTEGTSVAVTQLPKTEHTFESGQDVLDNAVLRDDTVQAVTRSSLFNLSNENGALEQHESEHFSGTENSAITTDPSETQTIEQIDQNNREVLSNPGHDCTVHSDTMTIQTSTGSLETVPPRYQQFSVLATRLNSYRYWPTHLKQRPEDLAKAGLFYEGTNDYVRCFHCAGGLREWDPEDDPFYEHARWFPFCQFMRLIKGDNYIMGVQSGTIKPPHVQPSDKLRSGQQQESNLFDHPAVLSVMEMGYSKTILTKAITIYRKRHRMELSADKLLSIVWEIEENDTGIIPDDDIAEIEQTDYNENGGINDIMGQETSVGSVQQVIDELIEANRELREEKRCKVCLDEEASIVFLPCGHLVTCPMCASALRKCPVCRTYIRGTVKAIIL